MIPVIHGLQVDLRTHGPPKQAGQKSNDHWSMSGESQYALYANGKGKIDHRTRVQRYKVFRKQEKTKFLDKMKGRR